MTTFGPTKGSDLSVASSISGQARILAIVTVGGSLQTMTVPLSIIQNNNIGNLDTLADVSIDSGALTGLVGISYDSVKSQWVVVSLGNMRYENNLSEVNPVLARANLDVLSSASLATAYASINSIFSTTVGALGNVSISAAIDGNFLAYNSAAGEWQNRNINTADVSGIGAYITSASVSAAIVNFITSASASTMVATQLAPYITSASASTMVATQLVPYVTSASTSTMIATALTPYITSASASTMVATQLSPYITSASASLQFASVAHTHTLDNLSDVSVSTNPPDNYALTWSSTANQWVAAPGGASGIAALTSASDVSISVAADGQFLVFRTSDSKWHNEAFDYVTSTQVSAAIQHFITSASASSMVATQTANFITSASASTMVAAQLVPYITSNSVSIALGPYITSASAETRLATKITAIASASDVSIAGIADGQILVYASSDAKWHNQNVPDWITSASASAMIASQTASFITSASASTMVASQLSTYITANSVSVLLVPYITSNSVSVLLAATSLDSIKDVSISSATDFQFLAYNSAAAQWVNRRPVAADISDIGTYITSASVSSMVVNFITSASTSSMIATLTASFVTSASVSTMVAAQLVPYITSASAETRLATKISAFASASDVSISSPANGQGLIYSTSDNKWHNQTLSNSTAYLWVRDEKATGTPGGTSSNTTDHTRTLNTVGANTIVGATVAANQIVLPVGTYRINATSPMACDGAGNSFHRAFLYNVTGSSVAVLGTSENVDGTTGTGLQTRSFVAGQFTASVTTTYELRHYNQVGETSVGLGYAVGDGRTEVYAEVEIWAIT